MAKIKGEFYTKRDANDAMEKINKYCVNIKVFDYDYNLGGLYDNGLRQRDYDEYISRYSFGSMGLMGIPISPFVMDWAFSPLEYGSEMYGSYDVTAPKAILEAEILEDKYNIVKDRLYSCGAISVY